MRDLTLRMKRAKQSVIDRWKRTQQVNYWYRDTREVSNGNGDKNVCEKIQETKDLCLVQTFWKHNRFIRLSKQRIIQLTDCMNVFHLLFDLALSLKLGYSSFLIHINRPIYALRNPQLHTCIKALKSLSKLSSVVNVNELASCQNPSNANYF